jgi:hypothetical protein
MNGFVHPFNVHDKNYKIPIDVKLSNLKKMDNRTSEEIKRIIAGKLIIYSQLEKKRNFECRRRKNKKNV